MADKGKRMIFEDEYQYLKEVKANYPDPKNIVDVKLTKTTDSFVVTYEDNTTETITFLTDVTLS